MLNSPIFRLLLKIASNTRNTEDIRIETELSLMYDEAPGSLKICVANMFDVRKKINEKTIDVNKTRVRAEKKSSLTTFISFSPARNRTILVDKDNTAKGTIKVTEVIINAQVPYWEGPRAFVKIGIWINPRIRVRTFAART
jgi:hypothetical protein